MKSSILLLDRKALKLINLDLTLQRSPLVVMYQIIYPSQMIRHKVLVHTVHFFVSWTTGLETQGGRYCHIWAIKVMYHCEGYGFSSSLVQDRVQKSESLGLEQGIVFQETDQLVEDFTCSLDKRLGDHIQKNEISKLKFCP